MVTAIANDISYEDIFYFQLNGRLTKDDLILAISGSGNSKNIIKVVEYAKSIGSKIISFTGFNGGKLKLLSDININANINNMQKSEDIHIILDHMVMSILYNTICNKS